MMPTGGRPGTGAPAIPGFRAAPGAGRDRVLIRIEGRPDRDGRRENLLEQTDSGRGTEPEEIAALVGRIREGDREAFKSVVRLYQRKVFVMAFSILRNKEDALDAVQETFLRLYQKSDSYRPGHNFQGWLLQIARNISIDYYRKHRQKKHEWEIGRPVDELPVAVEDRTSDSRDSDLRSAFASCVERLAARQKMVFVMRHYNELQFNEISEVLRISPGTAKSLHFKAVQNLRKWLTPHLGMER
jgi:RNA polymerase sigma-70 factor (ECF subfamily)